MAEEDNEVLDWGNEDDVVSLGDEDERSASEDPPAEQSRTEEVSSAVLKVADSLRSSPMPPTKDEPPAPTPDPEPAAQSPEPRKLSKQSPTAAPKTTHKLTVPPRLTHALPAKPVTTNIPYVPPSDPSIVEATAMASRPKKDDNSGHELKDGSRSDHIGPLPPQWEIRFSRDRPNDFYYYHTRHHTATWDRPTPSTGASAPDKTTLSHDDRHYRPEGRNALGSTRRHESSGDDSDARHTRHHPGNAGRSPPRDRDRSRSPSPQRDTRPRGNQRSTRGRPHAKSNGSQREPSATDAPKDEDRHYVPSPAPNLSRSARRQQIRSQNQSTNERPVDSRPEVPTRLPLPREASERGNDRGRDRTFTPDYPSNNITAPRPVTPPQEEQVIIYQTEPRREVRNRSPGPAIDPNLPLGDRPSRFGPGSEPTSSLQEMASSLPMKPPPAPAERQSEVIRDSGQQYERRVEPDRPVENVASQYVPPPNRSPIQPRETWNSNRGRASPVRSENSGSPSSRKRQPLPPQEAEFRGVGKPKLTHHEVPVPRPRDLARPPSFSYQGRDNSERPADLAPPPLPLQRSYSGYSNRDVDTRDVRYGPPQSAPREIASEYRQGYEHEGDMPRTRPRPRPNDQNNLDRSFGLPDPPPISGRAGFQERDRDPPSKPRAMQGEPMATPSTYAPVGASSVGPQHTNRYRDRPSPPHLSVSDSRGDPEIRPGPPPSVPWQDKRDEQREEKPYIAPERGPARELRGRQAPASSANSIPIGTRRTFSAVDPVVNDYPPSAPNGRFERQTYPPNDAQWQTRNYNAEYPRSYSQKEPPPEPRPAYPRGPREDSYMQPPLDDRTRRTEKTEPPKRSQAPLPSQPPESNNIQQQRQSRFTGLRTSRFDHGQPSDPPPQQQKTWSSGYDTSPRGLYSNDSARERDPTPPPLSREPSYTSPQWDPPSPNYHNPLPQTVEYQKMHEYRNLPSQAARMDIDPTPNRQAPIASTPHGAPSQPVHERYRRKEVENEAFTRAPAALPSLPPRGNNRRDPPSFSSETRRAPAINVPADDVQRDGGVRPKWDQAVDEHPHKRPRLLNERISDVPPPPRPDMRVGRKLQGNRQDNGYNGEPDAYEVRASGRTERQENYVPLPVKTFEQRLDPIDEPPMSRGGMSLLSRISHGGNNAPLPPSLRDRVQAGNKRDREEMVRSNFPEAPFEADDGDPDSAGARRRNKRRRGRRGGGPA